MWFLVRCVLISLPFDLKVACRYGAVVSLVVGAFLQRKPGIILVKCT